VAFRDQPPSWILQLAFSGAQLETMPPDPALMANFTSKQRLIVAIAPRRL
tara:strand:+ start:1241 stop:1390 length:150 start_codon:yes stop_codon:yes gene_type:complete